MHFVNLVDAVGRKVDQTALRDRPLDRGFRIAERRRLLGVSFMDT